MTAMWQQLMLLLDKTLGLYQALLESSRNKRSILAAAKSDELELVTRQEEALIIEAGKLEAARGALVRELAAASGLALDEVSLSCLCEHADRETAPQLKGLSGRLAKVVQELVSANELNTKLIEQSLDMINYNINILSQSTVGPTYAARGQSAAPGAGRILLDAKV